VYVAYVPLTRLLWCYVHPIFIA